MAYSWLRQWAHTKMEELPPECVQIATALVILWKTVSTDTPSHIGTQWLRTKSPADWLTRTASRLSTRWVWAKGCIYFRGIYGPCCAPATHTSTSQDTRPQGLQVAAHGKRASGPPYNPDQPEPTSSDNQGLWGSGVDIFPQRSHTYWGRRMPMGVTSNWCHPQGHHARRPPTTVPVRERTFRMFRDFWHRALRYLIIREAKKPCRS